MLTLEKVKPSKNIITRGTKLLCYETSYSFKAGSTYKIYNIKDGDIIVMDRDGIQVIFSSLAELKSIFMIVEE